MIIIMLVGYSVEAGFIVHDRFPERKNVENKEDDYHISYHLDGEDKLIILVNAWDHEIAREKARDMMNELLVDNDILTKDGWKEDINPKIIKENISCVEENNIQFYRYKLLVSLSDKKPPKRKNNNLIYLVVFVALTELVKNMIS